MSYIISFHFIHQYRSGEHFYKHNVTDVKTTYININYGFHEIIPLALLRLVVALT